MPARTPGTVGDVNAESLQRSWIVVRRCEHPAPIAACLADPTRDEPCVPVAQRGLELLDPAPMLSERGEDGLLVVEEDVDPDPRVRAGDPRHVAQRAAGGMERVVAVDPRLSRPG